MMLPQELIRKKRDGQSLTRDEVKDFIAGLTTQLFNGQCHSLPASAKLFAPGVCSIVHRAVYIREKLLRAS